MTNDLDKAAELEGMKQAEIVRSEKYSAGRSNAQKLVDGIQVSIFARQAFKSGADWNQKNNCPCQFGKGYAAALDKVLEVAKEEYGDEPLSFVYVINKLKGEA